MEINKHILTIILIMVLAISVYFGSEYILIKNRSDKILSKLEANEKVIAFQKIFVEKVFESKGEVSYKDKLKLETAAASANNENILNAWHEFLASKTESEKQNIMLKLLDLLSGYWDSNPS